MAENSIREQILLYTKAKLKDIEGIVKVQRKQPADMSELKEYSELEFPLICMVGSLPDPMAHEQTRGPVLTIRDLFLSDMSILMTTWLMDNEEPDSKVSFYLDEIWRTFYADQEFGGLIEGLSLHPRVDVVIWEPYVGFNVEMKVQYYHGIGGI